jgi:hypothetical protein
MIAKMRRFVVKTFLCLFFVVFFLLIDIIYHMLSPLSHIDGGAVLGIAGSYGGSWVGTSSIDMIYGY